MIETVVQHSNASVIYTNHRNLMNKRQTNVRSDDSTWILINKAYTVSDPVFVNVSLEEMKVMRCCITVQIYALCNQIIYITMYKRNKQLNLRKKWKTDFLSPYEGMIYQTFRLGVHCILK